MNVLVVDDHPVSRRLLRAVFEAERINVFEACDGIEALATLKHDRIDAIVADILMPRMDGYRLCHEIRTNDRLRETPVIIYTATYTEERDERLALELGADRFLKKPAPPQELVAVVRECIGAAGPHQAAGSPPVELARMRNYSERLVAKLEERNLELEETRAQLREANSLLEWRVQRRTEELAEANRQLESFASFVSHELRAPLRAIGGFARELEADLAPLLPATGARVVQRIERAARRTERLTETLLDFCRLGSRPLQRRNVELNAVVRAALVALAAEWKRRTVDIVVNHLPPGHGDALLLEHVFRNLLGNALKFTRHQMNPRIEVGVEGDQAHPVIYVRDNGVGFDMKYAGAVFEPFQQLHRDEGYEGTGLGLNLARNIVTRHGGTIWIKSAVNLGTTVFFSLERAAPAIPVSRRVGELAG